MQPSDNGNRAPQPPPIQAADRLSSSLPHNKQHLAKQNSTLPRTAHPFAIVTTFHILQLADTAAAELMQGLWRLTPSQTTSIISCLTAICTSTQQLPLSRAHSTCVVGCQTSAHTAQAKHQTTDNLHQLQHQYGCNVLHATIACGRHVGAKSVLQY